MSEGVTNGIDTRKVCGYTRGDNAQVTCTEPPHSGTTHRFFGVPFDETPPLWDEPGADDGDDSVPQVENEDDAEPGDEAPEAGFIDKREPVVGDTVEWVVGPLTIVRHDWDAHAAICRDRDGFEEPYALSGLRFVEEERAANEREELADICEALHAPRLRFGALNAVRRLVADSENLRTEVAEGRDKVTGLTTRLASLSADLSTARDQAVAAAAERDRLRISLDTAETAATFMRQMLNENAAEIDRLRGVANRQMHEEARGPLDRVRRRVARWRDALVAAEEVLDGRER
jgi:hypothetical protein